MQPELVSEQLLANVGDNGRISFNGNDLCMRDVAFTAYYLIKKGDLHKAAAIIKNAAAIIRTGTVHYDEAVFFLWMLGEYLNATGEIEDSPDFSRLIDFDIDYLSGEWMKPQKNWLGNLDEAIYLNNIAIAYGAVQSINNKLQSENARKLLIRMREFMFQKFLDQGRVVSRLGDKEILGDISLIAVPFGLLDAGNQILVESINVLEKELVEQGVRLSRRDLFFGGCIRSDLTCLLSWYYSERGNIARAKSLLEEVEKIWNRDGKLYIVDRASAREPLYFDYDTEKSKGSMEESYLGYVLYAIAQLNIRSKEAMTIDSSESIKIIHMPKGTENPYLRETAARYPHHPEKDDIVVLKMITQPLILSQEAYVEYSLNGNSQKRITMEVETGAAGDRYWKAGIGPFDVGDHVEYRFIVKTDDTQVTSKAENFTVRAWQPVGDITDVCLNDDQVTLYFNSLPGTAKRPCFEMKKHNDSTLKWSFYVTDVSPVGDPVVAEDVNIELDNKILKIGTRDLSINVSDKFMQGPPAQILQSYNRHGGGFIEFLGDGSDQIYKVRFKFFMDGAERFFGMGERYSHIEYRGHNVDTYVYNQYRDQRLRTYIPVPLAISSKGYGIYTDTPMYSVFRFGTRLSDLFEMEINIHKEKQATAGYIFTGNPKEIVQSFVKLTGKPQLPPKWSFGPWISSNNWDSQAETMKQVELTNKYKIPATVLVLEQWSDEATFYIFNDAQYRVKDGNDYLRYEDFTYPDWGRWPDPRKMVEDLHQNGLKVLLWQVPVEKYMDGIAHGQRDEDERAMLAGGYHVQYRDGKPYRIPDYEWFKRSLVLDFSNPAAREWWFNKRLYLLKDIGVDGFKTDGGECIYGEDVLFFDGRTGDEMRNQYANDYIGAYHRFAAEHVADGGVTFSRAGFTGAQQYPLHWAGDERSTYEAFRASVRAGLNCGMSGIPFWGWDLGGFHGAIPSAELYIRAAQMAAFCPIMQYHAETKGEFNQDRTPWNIAERTGRPLVIEIFKKYADLRMNLLPYIYQQAIQSAETGIPMMRPMVMEYPDDPSCMEVSQQYMFGDSLLVAPVTEEDSSGKDVYLPDGDWINFFSGEIVTGNRLLRVKAALENIPVYLRENSVIPLNLSDDFQLCSHVGNRVDRYENLCFMVFLTASANYDFRDDLGNKLTIGLAKSAHEIRIDLKSNYSGPILLIFANISKIAAVEIINNPGSIDNNPAGYTPDRCTIRDNALNIKVGHKNEGKASMIARI